MSEFRFETVFHPWQQSLFVFREVFYFQGPQKCLEMLLNCGVDPICKHIQLEGFPGDPPEINESRQFSNGENLDLQPFLLQCRRERNQPKTALRYHIGYGRVWVLLPNDLNENHTKDLMIKGYFQNNPTWNQSVVA